MVATNGSQCAGSCNPLLTCSLGRTCSPKTEPKVTVICSPKFEAKLRRSSNVNHQFQSKSVSSKNGNIQIHQYIEMSQDVNPIPRTFSSLVIFIYWVCERQEVYFLCYDQTAQAAKCTMLHTVATSNNRDHATRSLCYCLFVSHIFVCCS